MCPLRTFASAAVARAPPCGARSRPTSMATPLRSSKPKKAPRTARRSSPALGPACGLPSTSPAMPPFASPHALIPNHQPSPPSTPAIPPSAASIPPPARFFLPTKLAMRLSPVYVEGSLEQVPSPKSLVTSHQSLAHQSVPFHSPALVEIPRERIKRRQKNRHQHDRRVSRPVRFSLLVEQVAYRRTQEKHLQPREDARRDFHQRILMKQRDDENRPADHRGREAHQHGHHVSLHRAPLPYCRRIMPLFRSTGAGRSGVSSSRCGLCPNEVHHLLAQRIQAIHDPVRFHVDQCVSLDFLISGLDQRVMILAQVREI